MKIKNNTGFIGSTFKEDLAKKDYTAIKAFLLFLVAVGLGILFVDFIGFLAWIISGQFPVDSFYLGSITSNLIQFLIG
jgi:hypothetical protein